MKTVFRLLPFSILCVLSAAGAATWYVNDSVGSSGDGASWGTAFKSIQEGIAAASDGDEVLVEQGTYTENIDFSGKNIVLRGTDPLDSAAVANTIIDGNQAGPVVTFAGSETEACILYGFTITNGRASYCGGGVCTVWPHHTNATIQSNVITQNQAEDSGGGLAFCDGIIQNNTIIANSAMNCGGLLRCNGLIQNNIISGNSGGTYAGGGLLFCDGTIQKNTIIGNSAQNGGGLYGCQGMILGNAITGNSARWGGALLDCDGNIANNTIAGNSAELYGGGLYWCDGTNRNNTIVFNSADGEGGGFCDCHGTIINCIIWGNTAPSHPQLLDASVPTYSCIEEWTAGGEGNTSSDPVFVDADGLDDDPDTLEDNDYRLLPSSPCIDAGTNEDWMTGAVDLDGNPRILLGALSLTVDIGAYELRFPLAIVRKTETEAELSWTMRPARSYTVFSTSDMILEPWTEEATMLGGGTGGPASWIDPAASSSLKFYRIAIE